MAKTAMKIKQQRKQKFSTREYNRCRICDGSIMVIESGVISYRFAQEVKSQLERSNCHDAAQPADKSEIIHPIK